METSGEIQYVGLPGVSVACVNAVMRLIQFGDRITDVRILSCAGYHGLLLSVNVGELVAVKSGFSSGYAGEGPRALATVLRLLSDHGAEVLEYDVRKALFERLDSSSLTDGDLRTLAALRPVRPSRWYSYLGEDLLRSQGQMTVWREFPHVMPYSIIDSRIADLAKEFFDQPDAKLMTGYRRLEDLVRDRTGIDEHGQKLFAAAFNGDGARLAWRGIGSSERAGRVALFTGTYSAYRNPRAHQEPKSQWDAHLQEFLLLNHLYQLEAQAEEAHIDAEAPSVSG